jgi:hypothetical protein
MSARRPSRSRGIAVVEFAIILPIMLILMFLIIEFGRAILTRQVMLNISREAANLSARGTSMSDAATAAQLSASPLDLKTNGYVIISKVFPNAAGVPIIIDRFSAGGRPRPSKIGNGIGGIANLPPTNVPIPPSGQDLFVCEVFYLSDTITPLTQLMNVQIGDTFYDAAFF